MEKIIYSFYISQSKSLRMVGADPLAAVKGLLSRYHFHSNLKVGRGTNDWTYSPRRELPSELIEALHSIKGVRVSRQS